MIFDFHIHFSFKPANSKSYKKAENSVMPDPDHWSMRFKPKSDYKILANWDKTSIKASQANGDALIEGNLRVICNSLYPLERGFIKHTIIDVISMLTGFSSERLKQLKDNKLSYFQALEIEYRNMLQNQSRSSYSVNGSTFKLVNSFDEIQNELRRSDNSFVVLNTVEGAHAFADDFFTKQGHYVSMLAEERKYILSVKRKKGDSFFEKFIDSHIGNIDFIKTNWAHVPFFVTFAHHYYNHLSGFAQSLGPGIDFAVNQAGGTVKRDGEAISFFHLGIHPWGNKVLAQLLKRKTEDGTRVRRILIDVKHMSVQSRLDYYMNVVRPMKAQYEDQIPIIKSHTAVSGRKNMKRSIDNELKLFNDEKDRSKYFFSGDINLFDDEILEIIQSDGLIGIMIDERRIIGMELPPEAGITYKEFSKIVKESQKNISVYFKELHRHKWAEIDDAQLVEIDKEYKKTRTSLNAILLPCYFSVILRQLFHIVEFGGGEKAWDHICLGTDYDGVINPLDLYVQAGDMKTLEQDLTGFWDKMLVHHSTELKHIYSAFLFGKKPKHWITKFLFSNGMEFLKKYFNDAYLLNGETPVKPIV